MTNEEKYRYILNDWKKSIEPLGDIPLNMDDISTYATKIVQIAGTFCKKYKDNSLEEFAYKICEMYIDGVIGGICKAIRAVEE